MSPTELETAIRTKATELAQHTTALYEKVREMVTQDMPHWAQEASTVAADVRPLVMAAARFADVGPAGMVAQFAAMFDTLATEHEAAAAERQAAEPAQPAAEPVFTPAPTMGEPPAEPAAAPII